MQLYKTNSGLKYQEEAYFVKGFCDKYLCVGGDFQGDMYEVGAEYSLEDYEVEIETKSKIQDFAISKTYLFKFWIDYLLHFNPQYK